jgi:dTDP-4-dehydrorhamnose reductase
VLRTSWVYGPLGSNFCRTMLRLLAERQQLGVVADQVGCPTSTLGLAQACWRVLALEDGAPQILHWSDAGAASWYDFAVAIAELGVTHGLLPRVAQVKPIPTADYPTPAQRPAYSLLDCNATRQALSLQPQHWRAALEQVLLRIASNPARLPA